jgi:predicted MFS family arabinose efflux permease
MRLGAIARSTPGLAEQFSTRVIFFIAGFAMSAWAPLVPFAKARIGADDRTLGFVLLCLGLGSIAAMPFAAALAARFGCRAVIAAAVLILCVALPMLAMTSSLPLLAASVFMFGAAIGTVDVTINVQAVIVEGASGRPMMSGFHGLFSVGGIAGAAAVSGLLWLGASPALSASFVAAVTAMLLVIAFGALLPYGQAGDAHPFAVPHGFVILVGALCFVSFLAEGAMLDWSALFIAARGAPVPGLGYATFAVAMTAGRLSGDRVVQSLGSRAVLILGGVCAAAGLTLAVFAPWWVLDLIGFALVGIGASNIVPVLYTALGWQTQVPLNVAVASATLLGYLGILAGPALIGFAAEATSLSTALLGVAVLLLLIAAAAPLVTNTNEAAFRTP